jgi:hypothetical protein
MKQKEKPDKDVEFKFSEAQPSKDTDLQDERNQEELMNVMIDSLIKGKYNLLTKEEDFYS